MHSDPAAPGDIAKEFFIVNVTANVRVFWTAARLATFVASRADAISDQDGSIQTHCDLRVLKG